MIRRLLLLAGALVLVLAAPAHAQYTPGVTTNTPTLTPGEPVTVTACCFEPGSTVTFTVGGATLGSAVANDSGVASGTFTVPASVAPGAATVTAAGVDALGNPVTTTGTATVAGGGTTATTARVGGLPVTGSDSTLPLTLVAAGLVAAGATTLLVLRTRKTSITT